MSIYIYILIYLHMYIYICPRSRHRCIYIYIHIYIYTHFVVFESWGVDTNFGDPSIWPHAFGVTVMVLGHGLARQDPRSSSLPSPLKALLYRILKGP